VPTDVNLASTANSTVTLAQPVPVADPQATVAPVADMLDEQFWRDTFPELSIGTVFSSEFPINALGPERDQRVLSRMQVEGYFHETDVVLVDLASRLSIAVERAHSLGIPPVFIFLFDETWAAFYRQHASLAVFLGPDYRVLPDFWAWRVDPRAGQAGWRPHRDKGWISLGPDGSPKSLTVWIPLTEANPMNGCMYVLPANRDPVYGTDQDANWQVDFPSIRALPGKPGDFFCWNQAVLHWGAQTSQFSETPRMSMALEFQRADAPAFNEPLLPTLAVLSFADRLKLTGKQILQYRHMYPLPPPMQALAERLVSS